MTLAWKKYTGIKKIKEHSKKVERGEREDRESLEEATRKQKNLVAAKAKLF